MNIERLIGDGSGGVFQISAASAALATLRVPDTLQQRVIDTGRISDKASFLSEVSAALQFPYYFGHNWDAFYDCLSDSADQFTHGLLVIFKDLSSLVQKHPDVFQAAVEVLNDAVTYWEEAGKQLVVLIGLNDPRLAAQLPRINSG